MSEQSPTTLVNMDPGPSQREAPVSPAPSDDSDSEVSQKSQVLQFATRQKRRKIGMLENFLHNLYSFTIFYLIIVGYSLL